MGVVFLVVVPTEKYEKTLKTGKNSFCTLIKLNEGSHLLGTINANVITAAKNYNLPAVRKNDLNIPQSSDGNAILRMEVELRDKHQPPKKQGKGKAKQFGAMDLNVGNAVNSVDVSMEKVNIWMASFAYHIVTSFSHRTVTDFGRFT